MQAIQDKTLNKEIADLLNSKNGKEVVMKTLFDEIVYSDLQIVFYVKEDSVKVTVYWDKLDLISAKARKLVSIDILNYMIKEQYLWYRSKNEVISHKQFEDLLLSIKP